LYSAQRQHTAEYEAHVYR